jgi:hypothetical protein
MNASRRTILFGAATAGAASISGLSTSSAQVRVPNPTNFKSGDFLWPRNPNAFVPYESRPGGGPEQDRQEWIEQKERFIKKARSGGDPELIKAANEIEPLSYNQFQAVYMDARVPGQATQFGSALDAAISTGHIAIVEVDDSGSPWVIEALWKPGVTRSPYTAWLKNRPTESVWHGRLKAFAPEKCAAIPSEAKKYVGSPYDFWNFNLADTTGFYCSKLVWLSVTRTLSFAIDDNPKPSRTIWLSPKQILNSPNVTLLFTPDTY